MKTKVMKILRAVTDSIEESRNRREMITFGLSALHVWCVMKSSLNIRFGLDESAQLMDLFEKTLFLEITDSTIDFLLFTVSMGVSFGDFSSSAGNIRAMGKTGGNQGILLDIFRYYINKRMIL